jgi:Tannase and feruloyl esterase
MNRRVGTFGLLTAALLTSPYLMTQANAQASPTHCQQLTNATLPDKAVFNNSGVNGSGALDVAPDATITLLDDAGKLTLTGSNAVNQTFCRVTIIVPNDNGTFTPSAINIEIWLPETSWNQRYEGVGGGGFAGTISAKASVESTPTGLVNALNAGYATASTDTGHPSSAGGAFVLNANDSINYGLAIDFFSRSLHELALQSKYIIQQFYGAKPLYSYWNGCSTGGRQGLIEAQDNPDDYDGIWAGSPAVDFDRLSDAQVWPAIVMEQEIGGAGIPQTTFAEVTAAANAACNKVGGFTDVTALGNPIIDDPRECNFDPAVLQCGRPGAPTNGTCLTPAEVTSVKLIWYGPREVDFKGQPTGPRLWFGIEPGASFAGVADTSSTAIIPHNVGGPWIQDWLEQNPSFSVLGIDYPTYQQLFRFSEQRWTSIGASDNPDLSAFAAHGGKVIITHGWADQEIPTQDTVNYYNNVLQDRRNGGPKAVQDFARLFMVPGMGHCGGAGAGGPNLFDAFDPVVTWRETGVAPKQITASLENASGQVVETRPLCRYPQVARYTRTGSTNDASSFVCVDEQDNDALNATHNNVVPDPYGVSSEDADAVVPNPYEKH